LAQPIEARNLYKTIVCLTSCGEAWNAAPRGRSEPTVWTDEAKRAQAAKVAAWRTPERQAAHAEKMREVYRRKVTVRPSRCAPASLLPRSCGVEAMQLI
jgi:hypothetical protein